MSNFKENIKKHLTKKYGEPTSLDELFDLVKNVLEEQTVVIGLAWSVSYRENISNTHYAPINGETNWGCKDDKPRGYPGFTGRVWVRIGKSPRNGWISDMFNKALTYPGTGGAGPYDGPWTAVSSTRWQKYGHRRNTEYYPEINCYSWDFRFFSSDFPEIVDTWIKNNLFNAIKTSNAIIKIDQYKVWEDPQTALADQQFIEQCKFDKELEHAWEI